MENLAGSKEADKKVSDELTILGIELVPNDENRKREVSTRWEGKLGPFTFRRAWYYWVVEGPVPVEVAKKLYETPVGKKEIRVAGHCGCPPPEGCWVNTFTKEGKEVILDPHGKQEKEWNAMKAAHPDWLPEGHLFAKSFDPETMRQFVMSYHIDTMTGMYNFVQAIKEAGLIPKP